jgi:prepilin peptidase CpaA
MVGFPPVHIIVALVASVTLALVDVCKFKIANVFTYPLAVTGLVYHAVVGGMSGFADGLLGCVLGFTILLPFYALGGMGGGDVKLLGGIGAWLGTWLTLAVILLSCLVSGIYALILIVHTGRVRETWINLQLSWLRVKALARQLGADDRLEAEVQRPDRRGRLIPFGAMVAVGLITLLLVLRLLSAPSSGGAP